MSLHCIVTGALDPPLYIIWYHGADQLFPDNKRGWRTEINRDNLESNSSDGTVNDWIGSPTIEFTLFLYHLFSKQIGTLTIPAVKKRDSGNYTCSPSNSAAISTTLHVINGKKSFSQFTHTQPCLPSISKTLFNATTVTTGFLRRVCASCMCVATLTN